MEISVASVVFSKFRVQELLCCCMKEEMRRNSHHGALPASGQFWGLLLGQIGHRMDVVLAIRQLFEGLSRPVDIFQGSSSSRSLLSNADNSNEVSELCRTLVEPFCSKLLEFIEDFGFPRVFSSALAALAATHETMPPSKVGPVSLNISTPADFLCSCLSKLGSFSCF